MDLDAFVAAHRAEWDRLHRLARTPRRRLTSGQVDELVVLYHRAATHLSMVRSRAPDPGLVSWLSGLVLRARATLTPSPGFTWQQVLRFFTTGFPGEVFRAGRWCLAVAAAFVLLTGVRIAVVAQSPEAFASPAEIEQLVQHGFEEYYSMYRPENFALQVWTNNAYLTAVCLAAGVLFLPVLMVLWTNAENLGVVGGLMIGSGRGDVFFELLLVHGLLELTAVFIAAGVGLRIGWAWVSPGGELTRRRAVAHRARSGMVVALGLVPVLAVSALLEAFVTPTQVPAALRLAVGAAVWLAVLGYLVGCGARAVRHGPAPGVDHEVVVAHSRRS